MNISRRKVLALGAGLGAVVLTGFKANIAFADEAKTQAAIDAFANGATVESGKITLTAPEIAENGNTVPISIEVESPMTADDYVQSVMILAEGNPNPGVATLHFTPMSGVAAATTRMRLAKTQNVIAIAKMSDGSVVMDKKLVKVTIGGCGG
ncbi:thiosulfate oxidation carrier protein SoxY [Maritalea porphyrae]|uniref:thiosulfate oxidation carrier protein SoxY n=1 Tax=Maritalea porphyrae TaxID=880732 RepID=UPI0022B066F6|nr:thiosulfate oxidation carrier protein SoxY [Maritalea porphyrae]MCZ4271228.1 thiosulfate oxidation carrier protein SoxY [Maritalea porphyrae]